MAFKGNNYNKALDKLHPNLKSILMEVAKIEDIYILCSFRGETEQNKAFLEKKSKAKFGQSPHNFNPALAFDIAPFPLNWNDIESFKKLSVIVLSVSKKMNIGLVWGGDWKSFKDYPHYELKNWNTLK